jgi:hypothetical protein
MFQVGTKVNVLNVEGECTVVGHGFYQSQHYVTTSPAYIVRMDRGVWTEGHGAFIDTIVVHPDNVQEVE